jgi:chromosome segregation ATPase
MDTIQPDHEGLNKELSDEILGLRGRLLTANRTVQLAVEQANSLSARLDEAQIRIRQAEAAQLQAEGNLAVLKDSIPALRARISKLESDLRYVVDLVQPVYEKTQALRPE